MQEDREMGHGDMRRQEDGEMGDGEMGTRGGVGNWGHGDMGSQGTPRHT